MSKLTTGSLTEHHLIAEAREISLAGRGGMCAEDRLTYMFAGCMIGNKLRRALSGEMHSDTAAYEVAIDILRERREQAAAARYALIAKPPEPEPAPAPQPEPAPAKDAHGANGKTVLHMPGRTDRLAPQPPLPPLAIHSGAAPIDIDRELVRITAEANNVPLERGVIYWRDGEFHGWSEYLTPLHGRRRVIATGCGADGRACSWRTLGENGYPVNPSLAA